MEKFRKLTAIAAPLIRDSIDTDTITPGIVVLRLDKKGFGDGLFAYWRYDDAASEKRSERPDFILNQEPYRDARILLTGPNFGCGSSRETAVWALRDWGIRCIIAPSFGGIFYANCFQSALLPVVLPRSEVEELARQVLASDGRRPVTVDLETCTVTAPEGQSFAFTIAENFRRALLEGLDPIDATLQFREAIDSYEIKDRIRRPWIYEVPQQPALNGDKQ